MIDAGHVAVFAQLVLELKQFRLQALVEAEDGWLEAFAARRHVGGVE